MASAKMFLKSGHPMTLLASFLYFDFSFAVWVLNGAMAPFITERFHLSPGQVGLMVSVPTFAGALMRFPLGVLSQYIGRKSAAIVEMSCIIAALLYGYLFVHTFSNVLAMGVLLGIAGASFGVALSLGSGWFPKEYKGLAMGIAGVATGRLGVQRRLHHHLWRLHRPVDLPAVAVRVTVSHYQGAGRHADHVSHADRQPDTGGGRLVCG